MALAHGRKHLGLCQILTEFKLEWNETSIASHMNPDLTQHSLGCFFFLINHELRCYLIKNIIENVLSRGVVGGGGGVTRLYCGCFLK